MAREGRLQVIGMHGQAKQDRDAVQADALFLDLSDVGDDEFALDMLVGTLDELRTTAVRLGCEELFRVNMFGLTDDFIGDGQDGFGAAVVLLEFVDCGVREELGKFLHVADIGAAEGVDALHVVADDHHIVVRGTHESDELGLETGGVLVFVTRMAR